MLDGLVREKQDQQAPEVGHSNDGDDEWEDVEENPGESKAAGCLMPGLIHLSLRRTFQSYRPARVYPDLRTKRKGWLAR